MLTQYEQSFLLILREYIHGMPAVEDQKSGWDEVFKIAVNQSLDGIVFHQCKRILPKEIKRKYLKRYIGYAGLAFKRKDLLLDLIHNLEKQSTSVIFMKGAVFRDLYSVSSLRSMGDIDIIIHNKDRNTVDSIFCDHMGFKKFVDNHAVWTYWKDNLYFEIHDHMFYENLTNDIDYVEYFDHVFDHVVNRPVFGINSECVFVPEDNYHFLYLMAHTAKHIINSGSGFRAYLDMVLMCRNCDLDWEWISTELQKLKLLDFTETCFALCEKWFDIEMPLKHKELDPVFYEQVTEKTFRDGVFGLDNTANEGAHVAKEVKRENKGYLNTSIKLVFHLLFPPYYDMVLIPWYSFIRGKPWLMPFAWVYRWIYCLLFKFKTGLKKLTEPFRIRKKIEKREDYISTWGL